MTRRMFLQKGGWGYLGASSFVWVTALAVALSTAAVQVWAQDPVKFDIVSIRPTKNPSALNEADLNFLDAIARSSRHGRFELGRAPVGIMIQLAYDVKNFQVEGLPDWAKTDEFDVNARADGELGFEQMRPMLQTMLADRFGLKFRREMRELPVYELGADKAGLRIVPEKDGGCVAVASSVAAAPPIAGHPMPLHVCGGIRVSLLADGGEDIEAVGVPMPKLVEMLSKEVGRTVVDKTGFLQTFDFHLRFTPENGSLRLPPGGTVGVGANGNPISVSLFTALQEQLGLRLQSARGPVEVLVVEKVEKPTAN